MTWKNILISYVNFTQTWLTTSDDKENSLDHEEITLFQQL